MPVRGQVDVPDRAFVDRHCLRCHNDRLKTAGLTLETLNFNDVGPNAEVLEKVVHKLGTGQMPPPGNPRTDIASQTQFLTTLKTALDRAAAAHPNPGWVPPRRLNRTEYINVVQDLLGLDVSDAGLLPADTVGFGFDTNADGLAITPALMAR